MVSIFKTYQGLDGVKFKNENGNEFAMLFSGLNLYWYNADQSKENEFVVSKDKDEILYNNLSAIVGDFAKMFGTESLPRLCLYSGDKDRYRANSLLLFKNDNDFHVVFEKNSADYVPSDICGIQFSAQTEMGEIFTKNFLNLVEEIKTSGQPEDNSESGKE